MPTAPDKHDLLGFPGIEAEPPRFYIRKLWLVAQNDRLAKPYFNAHNAHELMQRTEKVVKGFVQEQESQLYEELKKDNFLAEDAEQILVREGHGEKVWGPKYGAPDHLFSLHDGPKPKWADNQEEITLILRYWMAARIQARINTPWKETRGRPRGVIQDARSQDAGSQDAGNQDEAVTPPQQLEEGNDSQVDQSPEGSIIFVQERTGNGVDVDMEAIPSREQPPSAPTNGEEVAANGVEFAMEITPSREEAPGESSASSSKTSYASEQASSGSAGPSTDTTMIDAPDLNVCPEACDRSPGPSGGQDEQEMDPFEYLDLDLDLDPDPESDSNDNIEQQPDHDIAATSVVQTSEVTSDDNDTDQQSHQDISTTGVVPNYEVTHEHLERHQKSLLRSLRILPLRANYPKVLRQIIPRTRILVNITNKLRPDEEACGYFDAFGRALSHWEALIKTRTDEQSLLNSEGGDFIGPFTSKTSLSHRLQALERLKETRPSYPFDLDVWTLELAMLFEGLLGPEHMPWKFEEMVMYLKTFNQGLFRHFGLTVN